MIAALPIQEETGNWMNSNAYLSSETINGHTTGTPALLIDVQTVLLLLPLPV